MTKSEFAAKSAERLTPSNAQAEKTISAVLEALQEALAQGENVNFIGFGSFGVKERAARSGVNPSTKAKLDIPATTVPYFKAGKKLKAAAAKKIEVPASLRSSSVIAEILT